MEKKTSSTRASLTHKEREAIIAWVADCFGEEEANFLHDDASDQMLINGINSHYCGGWDQFKIDA